MGNIIKVNFGKPVKGKGVSQNSVVLSTSKQELITDDVRFFQESTEHKMRVRDATTLADALNARTRKLMGVQSSRPEILEIQGGIIETMSLDSLCGYILSSDESMWRERPNFYGSVHIEMKKRINAIHQTLKKPKDE